MSDTEGVDTADGSEHTDDVRGRPVVLAVGPAPPSGAVSSWSRGLVRPVLVLVVLVAAVAAGVEVVLVVLGPVAPRAATLWPDVPPTRGCAVPTAPPGSADHVVELTASGPRSSRTRGHEEVNHDHQDDPAPGGAGPAPRALTQPQPFALA